MTTPRARLTVLAGPTAVGKGTVSADLRARYPQVWLSVSATTRPPRPGEVDGLHYHFVSPEEFDAMAAGGELLEWALVHGTDRYGTPAAPVRAAVASGRSVILEIELQGARQVKERLPEARLVFIAPPAPETLQERLLARGTETPEQMARRLRTAEVEMAAAGEFDHVVVNDDLGIAVQQLVELLGL